MKHYSLLLLVFLISLLIDLKAQETKLTQNVFTVTIVEPGITYEASLGNKFTAKFRAGLNAYLETSTNPANTTQIKLTPYPFIGAGARYYYGFDERNKKGKNTLRNSANYAGILASYGFVTKKYDFESGPATITTQICNVGFVWGLQRNYKNRFSLDFNIGPSITELLINNSFGITSEFTLGIWLGKKTENSNQ
jgi:Protein of unknown function (DUF3575)